MRVDHPIKSNNNKFLLGWFVLVSALAHLLFISLTDNKAEQTVFVNFSTPLQITVVSSRPATKTSPQAIPQKAEPVTKPAPVPLPLSIKAEKNAHSKNKPTVQTEKASALPEKNHESIPDDDNKINFTAETPAATPVTTTEILSVKNVHLNHLQQQLKQAIKARFTYPRIARRMGWEGLVGISLHIEDDGSLNRIQIARSSGHKVLDENAKQTIEKIGRIQVASNFSIHAADTEIEVLYKLTD